MAGRTDREGISLLELTEMFPDEEAAREWFEARIWADGRRCPRCDSDRTSSSTHKTMPYWCSDCRSYFSVRTNTLMETSNLPLKKWAFAIYLELTSLKGVSSLKLARDIRVQQKTAWFMLHRIRAAFRTDGQEPPFTGPVEFDETETRSWYRSSRQPCAYLTLCQNLLQRISPLLVPAQDDLRDCFLVALSWQREWLGAD